MQVCYAEELDVYVELVHSPRLPFGRAGSPRRLNTTYSKSVNDSFLEELRLLEEENAARLRKSEEPGDEGPTGSLNATWCRRIIRIKGGTRASLYHARSMKGTRCVPCFSCHVAPLQLLHRRS